MLLTGCINYETSEWIKKYKKDETCQKKCGEVKLKWEVIAITPEINVGQKDRNK